MQHTQEESANAASLFSGVAIGKSCTLAARLGDNRHNNNDKTKQCPKLGKMCNGKGTRNPLTP
jgi:hypothetical protein